jgi:hypothetical protein
MFGHKKTRTKLAWINPRKNITGTAKHGQTSRVHKSEYPKGVTRGLFYLALSFAPTK